MHLRTAAAAQIAAIYEGVFFGWRTEAPRSRTRALSVAARLIVDVNNAALTRYARDVPENSRLPYRAPDFKSL